MTARNDRVLKFFQAVAAVLLCAIATFVAGCVQGSRDDQPVDPLWSAVIAAHTTGPISKKGDIRVLFNQDVVAAERVGQDAAKSVSSKPRIAGKVQFVSRRELVWTPTEELERGRSYRIELASRGLTGVPATLSNYVFAVQVQAPEFEVRVDPLQAGLEDKELRLSGHVLTADVEASDRVERLLKAEFLARALSLKWEHSADGRVHRFGGVLARQLKTAQLRLQWTGDAISAQNKGERNIEVPAVREFSVTGVSVGDAGARQIDIAFSDALARNQDLRGLVQLSRGMPSFRIDGNLLRVYVENDDRGALDGEVQVTLAAAIRNERNATLQAASQHTVTFVSPKPQLRFVGTGTVLPEADRISIPVEAVNLRSIRVTAFRVFDDNLPQFLQVNGLEGERELRRVGRYLWRKHIRLTPADGNAAQTARWQRYNLDVTELLRKYPDSLVRLSIAFARSDIDYDCPGLPADDDLEAPPQDAETGDEAEQSYWDYYQDEYENEQTLWSERDNPCKRAYYLYAPGTRAGRNLMVSNLGLLAKRDQHGKMLVVVTDLRTSQPIGGAQITALNFQNRTIASVMTGGDGLATFKPNSTPYLLVAEKGGQKGYLKVAPGVALPVSHFDVGGEQVAAGLKAMLYGERGVWRPGDDIHLTLAVQDLAKALPANHPVKLELFDPRQQLVQTLLNDKPIGGLYAFTLQTNEAAPTGEWTAKATLGGSTFVKSLRVETVMPNRLKMDLAFAGVTSESVLNASKPLQGSLLSQWLTGAVAADLHADIAVRLSKGATKFSQFADYIFDDPAREFSNDPQVLFDGQLDQAGRAHFDELLKFEKRAPGMLNATFVTRVFEPSGAFSVQRQTQELSPYAHYVGLKLPKGDVSRNMLLTDTPHVVELASVDSGGKPISLANVEVTVYKIEWRWWWDQSGDSFAQYASGSRVHSTAQGATTTVNGAGQWTFAIKYPEWGRYLIRACDTSGGHCAAQVFYIDWPAWAGRPQDQSGPGASVLAVSSKQTDYQVGDVAIVDLPAGAEGRALVTVENGSRILEARWLEANDKTRRIELPLTAAMTPNVYVHVSLIQPHAGKNNDRPLRMYGIVPIKVTDPKTHLQPVLQVPTEWAPESKAAIQIGEASGRAMNYTLAVVDEGLLGLTGFKTPKLHEHFYKREALGVSTWDLFDQVAGAYQADLERLLALGGSDAANTDPDKNKSRFPPVVKFLGPFTLAAGKTVTHDITLPKYVGAVRVMVVAGIEGAYGSAEKSVFVRQPLMILPTLPRMVGPNEEIAVPISVFAMDASVKQAQVTIEVDALFATEGSRTAIVNFSAPGEQLAMLRMKTGMRVGQGAIKFLAVSGKHRATATIDLAVRSPNAPSAVSEFKTLRSGERWTTILKPHGLRGTNTASLEVSAMPPLNLENRLTYLIQYPHGCLEQTTSGAFPQLYLSAILKLGDARKQEVQKNINGGIDRLRLFQQSHGGFAYWPGNEVGYATQSNFDPRASWTTNYAGHFLLEAERLGYHVPAAMRAGWLKYQQTAAQSWLPIVGKDNHSLDQAYRLFTLSLASQPDMAAMNRLREAGHLPLTARWLLGAAYKVAGVDDAARALTKDFRPTDKSSFKDYSHPDELFGSRIRDAALVLLAMTSMGDSDSAPPLMRTISDELNSEAWYSTHTTAYGLLAMSKFATDQFVGNDSASYRFDWQFGERRATERSDAPVFASELGAIPDSGAPVTIANTSPGTLFVRLVSRGIAPPGKGEASSAGLAIDVDYANADGQLIDVSELRSGTDLIARITVRNNEPFEVKNIALTQMTAAGWEILNDRLDNVATKGDREEETRNQNNWYYSLYARARDKTEFLDIRDDRVLRYFALQAGEQITFVTRINAAYTGKFWLPGVHAEAMYDAARNARSAGQWVSVNARAK